MTMKTLIALVLFVTVAAAQESRTFTARLSTVPITIAMQEFVAGVGSVTATLAGNRLTIDGKYEGLRSPATTARIHLAPRAMRGPAVHELKVSGGTRGTISGSVQLDAEQRQALERNGMYIQLHSEKAPEGNLWGWLQVQEAKR